MMNLWHVSIILLLLPAFSSAESGGPAAQWGKGPVSVANQYFYSLLHSSLGAESPSVLKEGSSKFRIGYLWSNVAVIEDEYTTDAETRTVPFEIKTGIGGGFELGVEALYWWRGGGRLDSFIDGWHRFFSLPRGDRRELSDDSFQVTGMNEDGSIYDFTSEGWGFGSTDISAKYGLSEGSDRSAAWSILFSVGLPTARKTFGHDGVDLTLSILGSKRFDHTVLYWGGGPLWYSDTEVNDIGYDSIHFEGFSSIEYEWTSTLSLVGTLFASYQGIDGIEGHPDYAVYLDFGVVAKPSENWKIEALIRENPSPGYGTEDVTFGLFLTLYST